MLQVKTILVCLLAFLGALFGVALILLFASLEGTHVKEVWDGIFGGSDSHEPFTLPRREKTEPESGGPYDEVQSHKEWFARSGRNLRFHSAVLVAGSREYRNYRHQADICHAFHVLKDGGLSPERIITFIYDDVAHHYRNPYPGQLFNRPGGQDVYQGCQKDYTGNEVNRDVLFSVLKGDSRAVRGIGSGKVLSINAEQRVFFAYSDHGSVGSIGMPSGPPIYANELNTVFESMSKNHVFKELVFYLESCNSGSMFAGFNTRWKKDIFIMTAASSYESSFATYCPYEDTFEPVFPNATYIGTCLGDLFSVSWMEDTEEHDRSESLLSQQVDRVTDRTSNQGRYRIGSHVTQFGDEKGTIRRQVVGNFLSYFSAPSGLTRSDTKHMFDSSDNHAIPHNGQSTSGVYDQWTADLIGMYNQDQNNKESEVEVSFLEELEERRRVDNAITTLLELLVRLGELPKATSISQFAQELIPRSKGDSKEDLQVVNDWNCLTEMVAIWEHSCGKLTDYSRQYTRTFVNLCNALVSPSSFKTSVLQSLC